MIEHLAQRMMDLRSHGITKDAQSFERPAPGPWSYEQQELGFNYRMTDLQAALGLSQWRRLNSIVAERQRLREQYRQLLAGLPLQLLQIPQDVNSSLHLAVIRLADPAQTTIVVCSRVYGLPASGCSCITLCICSPTTAGWDSRRVISRNRRPTPVMRSAFPYPGLQDGDQQRVVRTLASLLAA